MEGRFEMKTKYFYLLFSILFLLNCEKDQSVNPELFIPNSDEIANLLTFQLVAKDSFNVFPTDNAFLARPYFSKIIFGEKGKNSEFTPLDTIVPGYQEIDKRFLIDFLYAHRVPSDCITFDLEVRFYLNDRDYRSTTLSIDLYKWIFPSSQLYFNLGNFLKPPYFAGIQGFELDKQHIYFHLLGPAGTYQYTFGQNTVEELALYLGGDWLALYQNYLYLDVDHNNIYRYDLNTSNFNMNITISDDGYIEGMDFKNDTLYILYRDYNIASRSVLLTYDVNLNPITREKFDSFGYSMTFYGDDLYIWNPGDIIRYHLPTKQIDIVYRDLDSSMESIQIANNGFFYSDVYKSIICYVPLADFLSNQITGQF
jgi:hypothetical protein